jgi:hypothetical protein
LGDVRDRAALEAAFQGADVVVHLAFMITGRHPGDDPPDQRRGNPARPAAHLFYAQEKWMAGAGATVAFAAAAKRPD